LDPFPWLWRAVTRLLSLERRPLWASRARKILGVWIVIHALAVLLVAIPVPQPLDETILGRVTVKREVATWHERLSALGYSGSKRDFEAFLVQVSRGWASGRNEALAPFVTYLGLVRVRQAWYMFTAPDRAPERFRVEFSKKASKRRRLRHSSPNFEPVFEIGQPIMKPEVLSPGFVHHYRVRRALLVASWTKDEAYFSRLCSAFEQRVVAATKRVRSVRCSLVQEEVEHPSHVGQSRRRRTMRTVTMQVKR
jgi:hypothetical protein